MDLSLYVITAEIPEKNRTHQDVAKAAIYGGASVLQFREKEKKNQEKLTIAYELREITKKHRIPFIVNDHPEMALAVNADGLHLGQSDMPLSEARNIFSSGIIGISVTSVDESIKAEREGADYLGVGPIFATPSKSYAGEPIGCGTLREIRKRVKIPLVAIGGINMNSLEDVIRAGANGIAVISAIAVASDMENASRELKTRILELKSKLGIRN